MTITDVTAFIQQKADTDDLDTLHNAIRTRHKLLREQSAAAVKTVTTYGLSPKYLDGLTGAVKSIEQAGGRRIATVTLNEESTHLLASRSGKYGSLYSHSSYDLTGIPLTALRPHGADAAPGDNSQS